MSQFLVRIYNSQGDKSNVTLNSFNEALNQIQKTEADIYKKVDWLHFTDYFFRDTNNYIREIKS